MHGVLPKFKRSEIGDKKKTAALDEGGTLWRKSPFALSVPQWLVRYSKADVERKSSAHQALKGVRPACPSEQLARKIAREKAATKSTPAGQALSSAATTAGGSLPHTAGLSTAGGSLGLAEDEEFQDLPVSLADLSRPTTTNDVQTRPTTTNDAEKAWKEDANTAGYSCSTNKSSLSKHLSPALAKARERHGKMRYPKLANQKSLEVSRRLECVLECEDAPLILGARGAHAQTKRTHEASPGTQKKGAPEILLRDTISVVPKRTAVLPRASPLRQWRGGNLPCTFHGTRDEGAVIAGRHCDEGEDDNQSDIDGMFDYESGSVGSSFLGRDRKWRIRMPPVSYIPDAMSPQKTQASTQDLGSEEASQLKLKDGGIDETGEYLNFENWGIDDHYISCICSAHSGIFKTVRHVNVCGNRITKPGLTTLLAMLSNEVQSINLENNGLNEIACYMVVRTIRERRWQLKELNLSANGLGDGLIEKLCDALVICQHLEGLGLAKNGIGRSALTGKALGSFIGTSKTLTTLDLHWNHFQGSSGYELMSGVYDNGENDGQLTKLNLAWNRLGASVKKDGGPDDFAELIAKMFASVFMASQSLFHLDLSYNGIRAAECKVLGDGLRKNHSLFGIHLNGNEATVDDLGFVVPMSSGLGEPAAVLKSSGLGFVEYKDHVNQIVNAIPKKLDIDVVNHSKVGARSNAINTSNTNNEASRSTVDFNASMTSLSSYSSFRTFDCEEEKAWAQERSKVQRPTQFARQPLDFWRRDTRCCWICENWVVHEVQYIPGVSDLVEDESEIFQVYAFYSIDNFSRALRLNRIEESFSRRAFKPNRKSTKDRHPALSKGGKLVRWVGKRMLPPTSTAIQIVFQVNDKLRVSDDMKSKKLPKPKQVYLKSSPEAPLPEEILNVPQSFNEFNVVHVAIKALEDFMRGEHTALVVLEDPKLRKEVMVLPRKLPEDSKPKEARKIWTFENSVWNGYKFDSEEVAQQCFDIDFVSSKLEKFIKGTSAVASQNLQNMFKTFLRPLYMGFICGYRSILMRDVTFTGKEPFGASLLEYTYFLNTIGPDFFDNEFSIVRDSDTIFIGANVIDRAKKEYFKNAPGKGLARCQFLEALTRVATKKHMGPSKAQTVYEAMKEFYPTIKPTLDKHQAYRLTFQAELFNEECDLVYRNYLEMLRSLYDHYCKTGHSYPGCRGPLTCAGFLDLLNDAKADCIVPKQRWCAAFLLAKQMTVDELGGWKHMQLSFNEYLVAIGAVIKMRDDFEKQLFADFLDEFMDENLAPLYHDIQSSSHSGGGGKRHVQCKDPSLVPVISFLTRLFEEADDDHSGTITTREFRVAFNRPDVLAEMESLGLSTQNVTLLFKQLDTDGSGECNLDEMIEGFVKMKLAMKGLDRVIAYIQRAFEEADEDQSGFLTTDEFLEFFQNPSVLKKLTSLGVDVDDIDDILGFVDADGSGEVTCDELLHGFIQMRDAGLSGNKACNFMRRLFQEADKDNSGSLTKLELAATFNTDKCHEKIKKLDLPMPNWEALFDQFDVDKSGDVSWDELKEGALLYWKQFEGEGKKEEEEEKQEDADAGTKSETWDGS